MITLNSDEQAILNCFDSDEAHRLYDLWKFETDLSTLRNKCVNLRMVMHLKKLDRRNSNNPQYPSLF